MSKYTFNHDGEDFADAFGIPGERVAEIQQATKTMAIRAAIDPLIKNDSQAFEILLNELQPSVVEAVLIGKLYGGYSDFASRISRKMIKKLDK